MRKVELESRIKNYESRKILVPPLLIKRRIGGVRSLDV